MIPWIVSVISILGVILNVKKKASGFTIMTIANIILIWYIIAENHSAMYGQIPGLIVYCVINTWGYREWTRRTK